MAIQTVIGPDIRLDKSTDKNYTALCYFYFNKAPEQNLPKNALHSEFCRFTLEAHWLVFTSFYG